MLESDNNKVEGILLINNDNNFTTTFLHDCNYCSIKRKQLNSTVWLCVLQADSHLSRNIKFFSDLVSKRLYKPILVNSKLFVYAHICRLNFKLKNIRKFKLINSIRIN